MNLVQQHINELRLFLFFALVLHDYIKAIE